MITLEIEDFTFDCQIFQIEISYKTLSNNVFIALLWLFFNLPLRSVSAFPSSHLPVSHIQVLIYEGKIKRRIKKVRKDIINKNFNNRLQAIMNQEGG